MEYRLNDERVRQHTKEVIDSLSLGDDWIVIISPYKKGRSNAQNRMYWSWVRMLSSHFGYTDEELHEVLCARFLGVEKKDFMGKEYVIRKSSAKLTTAQFTEFLDKVYSLGVEQGVSLPVPLH